MAEKLTDARLRGLVSPDGKRLDVSDPECPGLQIRIAPTVERAGRKLVTKTWALTIWKPANKREPGKAIKVTLGRYPAISIAEARKKANDARAKVLDGADPRTEKNRPAPAGALTLDALADRFQTEYAETRKRPDIYKQCLKSLRAEFGTYAAGDVTADDVRDFYTKEAARAPIQANRSFAAARKMFAWAAEQRDVPVDASPFAGLKKPSAENAEKDRYLTDAEIATFWRATEPGEGMPVTLQAAAALRLVLLTAARPGEVIGLETSELIDLDGDNPRWELPRERAKSGKGRIIPLSQTAAIILRGLVASNEKDLRGPSPYLFPSRTDRDAPATKWLLPQATADLRAATKMTAWTAHDLRRTASTIAGANGVDTETIAKLLGHSFGPKITAIYARFDRMPQMRQAVELIAADIEKACKSGANKAK